MGVFRRVPSLEEFVSDLSFQKISESDNEILDSKDFQNKTKNKYNGYLVYNKANDLIGYYWYTINKPPATVIPRIPKDVVWMFNLFVFENYRGNGYQKQMMKHFEKTFSNYQYLYVDILLNNTPSIKSVLKTGYKPCGIYYILVIGIRTKNLNIKMGYWSKTAKHKYRNEQ